MKNKSVGKKFFDYVCRHPDEFIFSKYYYDYDDDAQWSMFESGSDGIGGVAFVNEEREIDEKFCEYLDYQEFLDDTDGKYDAECWEHGKKFEHKTLNEEGVRWLNAIMAKNIELKISDHLIYYDIFDSRPTYVDYARSENDDFYAQISKHGTIYIKNRATKKEICEFNEGYHREAAIFLKEINKVASEYLSDYLDTVMIEQHLEDLPKYLELWEKAWWLSILTNATQQDAMTLLRFIKDSDKLGVQELVLGLGVLMLVR